MPDKHENETFEGGIIQLDGNQYIGCTFRRCSLQYGGLATGTMANCNFNECSWFFIDAAERTVQFMSAVYHGGRGGRELIEQTFENINQGRLTPPER
jgi:hypothetical protein